MHLKIVQKRGSWNKWAFGAKKGHSQISVISSNYLTNYPPLENQEYLTNEKGSLPGGRPWEDYLGETTLGRLPREEYLRQV